MKEKKTVQDEFYYTKSSLKKALSGCLITRFIYSTKYYWFVCFAVYYTCDQKLTPAVNKQNFTLLSLLTDKSSSCIKLICLTFFFFLQWKNNNSSQCYKKFYHLSCLEKINEFATFYSLCNPSLNEICELFTLMVCMWYCATYGC